MSKITDFNFSGFILLPIKICYAVASFIFVMFSCAFKCPDYHLQDAAKCLSNVPPNAVNFIVALERVSLLIY